MARKPRFVFKGARRQVLRKLERSLELIGNMDFHEAERSTIDGRDGDFFGVNATVTTAMQRLKNQASELLALKR